MSATAALLGKDLREHGRALLGIVIASLALVLLALAQNRQAAYGISPFEVVRFALITFLPLICLIVGNRLVAREYLSGTRQFLEALPIGNAWPLLLKYLTGLAVLWGLGAGVIAVCALGASLVDDPTREYLTLMAARTGVVLFLYWSVVFCFSLCGHLRVMLYVLTLGAVLAMTWLPGIDASRFAPVALLDREYFVFERDLVPWREMGWTVALGTAFSLAGFAIARWGNGAVAERLARPMSRRDHVMLGVLVAAGMGLAAALADRAERDPVSFTGETVLRLELPEIELYYGRAEYRDSAQRFLDAVVRATVPLETRLGLESVPPIRLALRAERDAHDIDYGTLDGVYVAANWLEHDDYDDAVLVAVVLHGILTARTGGRAAFEPYHWVLDGFTRWWSETAGDPAALRPAHRHELLARASFVSQRLAPEADLMADWQGIADRFGYPGAEALATTAVMRLEELAGSEAIMALGREFLSLTLADNVLASVRDRRSTPAERFERATGLVWSQFHADWRDWLFAQGDVDAVQRLRLRIPALTPRVSAVDRDGVAELVVALEPVGDARDGPDEDATACFLRHSLLTPFAGEWEVDDEDEREARCSADAAAFTLRGRYAAGDRVLLAVEAEPSAFHQPVRLGAARVDVP